jgi:hypothetical protein
VRQYRSTVALHNYDGEIFFILVYNPFLQSCRIYFRLSHGVSTIVETIRYVDEQLHMLWAEVGYNWDWGGGGVVKAQIGRVQRARVCEREREHSNQTLKFEVISKKSLFQST